MNPKIDYKAINKDGWNQRTEIHYTSEFYDNDNFIRGNSSLKDIELDLLGDLSGKSVLHLQCHFGQDSISMSRLGASVTGVDISDKAIEKAKELSLITNTKLDFICCDIYDLPHHLEKKFDIVFTSYGTIGWLPDLGKWGKIVDMYLKQGGHFIMADFHPVVWMLDDDFSYIKYNYFHDDAIIESETSSYTDGGQELSFTSVSWNHSLSDVINALIKRGLSIQVFNEYDFSPYNCFAHTTEFEKGKFRITHLGRKIPMVYSIKAEKQ